MVTRDSVQETGSDHIHEVGELESAFREIEFLFTLHNDRIGGLIEAINKNAQNLHILTFTKLTGTELQEAKQRRYTLAFLVHVYSHHPQTIEQWISQSKHSKSNLDAMRQFIARLDKRGIDGLNLIYEAGPALYDWPSLRSLSTASIQLIDVEDEKDEIIGFLPFVRAKITTVDDNDKEMHQTIVMSLEEIYILSKAFENMYQNGIEFARQYQQNIQLPVIVPEGDVL